MTAIYISEQEKEKIMNEAPLTEPERQFYFISQNKKIIDAKKERLGYNLTACINTFGCQMNAKDSEKLLGIITQIGYEETDSEDADFVLYNTCTVREHANLRVYGRLGVLKGYKSENKEMVIALCGCMMQEPEVVEKIKKSFGFVDIIFGTHNIYKLAELLFLHFCSESMQVEILDEAKNTVENLPSVRKHEFKTGVNIMYGCDNFCSYCIVPFVRGRERSRLPKDIIEEVNKLADQGIGEILLLGQNVNSYGKKFILDPDKQQGVSIENEGIPVENSSFEEVNFPKLLRMVEDVEGIKRIRFMTSHPKDLSDELIETIKQSEKICRHIHLPLQSGSTKILAEMNRHYTKEQYLSLVYKIRREIPDVSVTTDIIVGFPGETEEDFEETMDVVRKARFDSAFTFIYSKRTGTRAALMPNQIPKEVSGRRMDALIKLVNDISKEQTQKYAGRVMEVLVEDINPKDSSLVTGRLSNNAVVHFKGGAELIGKIVDVKLVTPCGFYYIGELA